MANIPTTSGLQRFVCICDSVGSGAPVPSCEPRARSSNPANGSCREFVVAFNKGDESRSGGAHRAAYERKGRGYSSLRFNRKVSRGREQGHSLATFGFEKPWVQH